MAAVVALVDTAQGQGLQSPPAPLIPLRLVLVALVLQPAAHKEIMDLIQYFQQLRLLVAGVEEAIPPGQMAALGVEEADIVVSLVALETPQAFPPLKEIMVVLEPRLRIMGVVVVAGPMQLLAPDLMVPGLPVVMVALELQTLFLAHL
jgi:hypothetical protein